MTQKPRLPLEQRDGQAHGALENSEQRSRVRVRGSGQVPRVYSPQPGAIFKFLCASVAVLWFCGVTCVSTAYAWEIASFDTRVVIHPEATATVTETIVADFVGESRHGLYRDIPIHYTDRAGQHFTLRLHVQSISDGAGHPWPYRLESSGRSQRLRIGDPDRLVSGQQTYQLIYEVQRGAVRFFPDHDECYWNLTGNEWAVPIRQVHAEVYLPRAVSDLRAVAYLGGYGSTDRVRFIPLADHVVIDPGRTFQPYEGLTAAVAWEKGVVSAPSRWQIMQWWLADNWVYGLPLIILIVMTGLWYQRGRDPRLHHAQVVEYVPPDGLTPAEVGTLMDQRVNLRDITATVIDLAVRGYLRIEQLSESLLGLTKTDYKFISLKPWKGDPGLKAHERTMLQEMFGTPQRSVTLSDLESVFYQSLPTIQSELYTGLVKAGYVDSDPNAVRTHYLGIACVLGIVLWMGLMALQPIHQLPLVPITIVSGLSALIVAAFSCIMPRRTLKGAEVTDRVLGFLEFLRRTDQDRARRMNDPSVFERCLPYALAFGVVHQWTRTFEGIYTKPPTWYVGTWDSFSARRFGYDLTHATTSMGRSFASAPRVSGGSSGSWGGSGFGGGGFSGGGGGGGGGGAW